tara:strand:- start:188 stop:505 length:318 start_codon:yes stop_codon:yes gene_type:complete
MKLHSESAVSLDSLKGAFVLKKNKEGKETTYRIYDFYIDLEPDWDEEKDEIIGSELTEIGVTLVPILSDGKLATEEMVGQSWSSLKDDTIQLSAGFPDKISNEIR